MGLPRALIASGISLGLCAGALWASGTQQRALALFEAPARSAGALAAIPGSTFGPQREVAFNGRPLRVQSCSTPLSPREVLTHYEQVARDQLAPKAPYVRAEGQGGGALIWTTPDGKTRAVLIEPSEVGAGATYRILSDEVEAPLVEARDDGRLPGGLDLRGHPRFRVTSSIVDEQGCGMAQLTSPGDLHGAAGVLLPLLEERGFRCDTRALEVYDDLSDRLVIPLEHPRGVRGALSLTPGHDAPTRILLSLHSAR